MKISQIVCVAIIVLLITLVCGYGHYLAEDSFIKWLLVLVWSAFNGAIAGEVMREVHK